ncbi:MAG TPA: murein biosynthesis integral membrane protein MurJ [Candidatus Angelobacter sp.]|jgi:putative peptidoglycan lipid II flippase
MAQQEKIETALPMPSSNGMDSSLSRQNGPLTKLKMRAFRKDRQDSTNRKIFRAAITIGLVSTVAKGGAVLKDLVVAHVFGRSDALDAFLIAFLIPSFVLALVMSSLGSALIPVLVETRKNRGAEAEQTLLSSVMFLSVSVLVLIAALLGFFAPFYLRILGSSFSPSKLLLTRKVLYCLLLYLVFSGLATFVSGALSAYKKFALPALVPVITPLLTITALLVAPKSWSVFPLAIGVVVGGFLEAAILLRVLKTCGIRFRLRWNGLDADVRSVLRQYAPVLAGSVLMCSTTVIDQAMAAMLPSGSVAALSYANKIVGLIVAIGSTALATAALPYFSHMVAEQDWEGCRHTLKRYTVFTLAASVPLTLLLMALSHPLIRLVFQRGAFNALDTDLVSRVQMWYFIQIPFYMCGMLFVRFLSSIRRNDVLMYGSAISLALDISLNLILMRKMGIAGIALSTSLVYIVAFVILGTLSVRLLRKRNFDAAIALGAGVVR